MCRSGKIHPSPSPVRLSVFAFLIFKTFYIGKILGCKNTVKVL